MLKLIMNRTFLSLAVIVLLGAIITTQELRYKNTLLTLQGKENALLRASESLTALSLQYEQQGEELLRQIDIANKSQRVAKDVAVQVRTLRSENSSLKNTLTILKKEQDDVKEYLNSVVPDSVTNSLRE